MNLVDTAPWWLVALLCVLLLAAAVEDFLRLRISNATTAGVLIAAIVAVVIHGWSADIWQNLVIFVVLLAGGTALFASGKVGGGDVKLLAAAGLWVNFQGALTLIPAVFIAGGALAVIVLSRRMLLRPAGGRSLSQSRSVPYGIAIAIGMLTIVAFKAQSDVNRHEQLTELNRLTSVHR
jgi:prepilin peptidase CpaA